MVVCYEGGYSSAYVPFYTLRVIEALNELQSKVTEVPFQLGVESLPTNVLLNHKKVMEEHVKQLHREYWTLPS
ncbi:hypothetical protein [Shimazuella kribbensis]|uniref:hypothetical protein n=1 Tax=Shimazuella kribbensis TaxID=139808 RepID=UPI00041E263A|nr:hypothetical protein [Shimazuella kribbensis]